VNPKKPFLDMIRESPHDDTPRLVFADFLEENNDAERAEFIRVQCELARPKVKRSRRQALKLREAELLNAHRLDWLKPLPDWARRKAKFERGFINEINTTALRFMRDVEKAFEIEPIHQARIRNVQRKLVPKLAECEHLSALTRLSLASQDLGTHIIPLFESPHFPRSIELNLTSNQLTNESFQFWLQAPLHDRLQSLSLGHNPITSASVIDLCELPGLTKLKSLNLRSIALDSSGITAIAQNPRFAQLEELILTNCRIGSDEIRILSQSPHLRKLRILDLSGCRLGTDGVLALASSPILDTVEVLDLWNADMGERGVIALTSSAHVGSLTRLALGGNAFGDAGMHAIVNSTQWPALRALSFAGCDISAEGARMILASPTMRKLHRLYLGWQRAIYPMRKEFREVFGSKVNGI